MKTVNEQILCELFDNTFSVIAINDDSFKQQIMEKHRLSGELDRKHRRFLPVKIALVSILILTLSITTYAAAIGGFEELLKRISPPFAQVVEPVFIMTEDNGIRLEVLAAQRYNNEAILYVTLQDMTEAGRIDTTTQLDMDFGVKNSSYGATALDYNPETGKATFEVRIRSENFEKNLKLHFNEISTVIKRTDMSSAAAIDIEEHLQETGNPELKKSGGHSAEYLESSQLAKVPGVDNVYLSAVGISDGWFCIQLTVPQNGGYDIWPWLIDADGKTLENHMTKYSEKDGGIQEFYFDVDTNRLSEYKIFFEGTQSQIIKGDWSVEVDISNPDQIISGSGWYENEKYPSEDGLAETEMASGEITITLNPLGLTVTGYGDLWMAAMQDVELKTTEGIIKLSFSHGNLVYTEEQLDLDEPPPLEAVAFESYFPAETPIDLNTVTEVRIDGNLIWEKNS